MHQSAEHAVTVLISRRVKNGQETAFEPLCQQLMEVASEFKGYLGSQLVKPDEDPDGEVGLYHVVLAFDSHTNLEAWQRAPARFLGLAAMAPLLEGRHSIRHVSGLGLWFQPPQGLAPAPPPRWKVALVTWLGIYPTVGLVFSVLTPLLLAWPWWARLGMMTALVVTAMTWLVAPQLTRWMRPWLYRTRPSVEKHRP